jgi:hypothetical protein
MGLLESLKKIHFRRRAAPNRCTHNQQLGNQIALNFCNDDYTLEEIQK